MISVEVEKALNLLKEEGSAVVFPRTIERIATTSLRSWNSWRP
ncbi:MAG: hypothetical protein QM775_17605 [Pirellulales bacterium]